MIKVGFLVSYDYRLLFPALEQVYNEANQIFISIDKNRMTWSGNKFKIPDSFFSEIESYDLENKIIFHEDNFYKPELSLNHRQTRQRILLHQTMGKGWKIFLDVDEYIFDFKQIASYLRSVEWLGNLSRIFPLMLRGKLITLYKQDKSGFYYINNGERFSFITNQSNFKYKRNNKSIKNFYTNIAVIHQSWAREEDEVQTKIDNWCHKNDFDTDNYFKFWKNIDESNYDEVRNFHPLHGHIWPKLEFQRAQGIRDFIREYSKKNQQEIQPLTYKILIKALLRINT